MKNSRLYFCEVLSFEMTREAFSKFCLILKPTLFELQFLVNFIAYVLWLLVLIPASHGFPTFVSLPGIC